MIHLITGGSSSGKSKYAEEQILAMGGGERLYIATMVAHDEVGEERIRHHRSIREPLGFRTIECPARLGELEIPDGSLVLVDDVAQLVLNEMFMPGQSGIHAVNSVIDGMEHIARHAAHLIIVTNEVFSDGVLYGDRTKIYMEFMGLINQHLGKCADLVTEMVFGIPIPLKRPDRPDLSL